MLNTIQLLLVFKFYFSAVDPPVLLRKILLMEAPAGISFVLVSRFD